MSHSVQQSWTNGIGVVLTILNYTLGGEAVSAVEVGTSTISGVIMGIVSPNDNSLGVPLLPVLVSGKILLYRFVTNAFAEVPTTTALNAKISAVILVPR